MQLIRSLAHYPADRPLALAIGNFDGLHCGHRAVIARMQAIAAQHALVPAVLTFEPHPRRFFAPQVPAFRLEPVNAKLRHLRALGIARVFALRFHAGFAALDAGDFLDRILRDGLQARAVVTGENFVFGKDRGGDATLLRRWGLENAISTEQLPAVTLEGEICSSTAVRRALAAGDMAKAALLLGRAYRIDGRVVAGAARGRGFGYPTANIPLWPRLKLPHYGVYAVTTRVGGRRYGGVANLGVRPTVAHNAPPVLEVHLFDYSGDLYGRRLEIEMHAFIRPETRFDSLAALTRQIAADADAARRLLKEYL